MGRSLIGEVKELVIMDNIVDVLADGGQTDLEVKYLGGLKVLLIFHSKAESEEFLNMQYDLWSQLFLRLYVWDGEAPVF